MTQVIEVKLLVYANREGKPQIRLDSSLGDYREYVDVGSASAEHTSMQDLAEYLHTAITIVRRGGRAALRDGVILPSHDRG